jgi:hypothetical protein
LLQTVIQFKIKVEEEIYHENTFLKTTVLSLTCSILALAGGQTKQREEGIGDRSADIPR